MMPFLAVVVAARAAEPPAWFTGCWEAPTRDGIYREVWLGPAHGELVGASLDAGAERVFWEHLRVTEVDGALAYVVSHAGGETVAFPVTALDADRAVFELPTHDFPQRITYERTATGLVARVEARDGDGWEGFALDFAPCGSAPPQGGPSAPPEASSVPAPACAGPDPYLARLLRDLARADQRERARQRYDGLEERDAVRLAAARGASEAGAVCAPRDAWHVGVVLQHGPATADHARAFALFAWACARGEAEACDWAPLAWDRSLVSAGRPQWFGTQHQSRLDEETGEHLASCLVEVDPAATDADRARWGRPPLAEVVAGVYARNGRDVSGTDLGALEADGLVCPAEPWGGR